MKQNPIPLRSGVPREEQFFCPECGEFLLPVDIEAFAHCPYCNAQLKRDGAFEEYVMLPYVNRWMMRTVKQFPRRG